MSDHPNYDAEFFAEQEQRQSLRKQVKMWINRYCATTGKPHSLHRLYKNALLADVAHVIVFVALILTVEAS